ncbi:MAG: DUF2138 domain-containing protein [Deferribacteraceae bacterium]|jgi:uncharacterized protein YfaA (DUF2138 family)|nr:DUF2138 domain-containing protein [Deferribacteraceae bacterium]
MKIKMLAGKKIALIAAAVLIPVIALVCIQLIWRPFGGASFSLSYHAVRLDIHHPDAVIDSATLSRLPADMIRLPLLNSLLTRDFVEYYESETTRLSAEGTLRKLAFEHNLDWQDELIKYVFDEPSRMLLWRSPDGRLDYWVMTMRRSTLAKLMQTMVNAVVGDSQLRKIAELSGSVPVYALRLAVGKTLLFAAKDDQLLIISEPGILLDPEGELIDDRAKALTQMLKDGGKQAVQSYHLDNSEIANGHRLVVSVNYLSFGYQTLFPDIAALRFDFNADGVWSTNALIDPSHLPQQWNNSAVWSALPANAAVCASLPVNWIDAIDLLSNLGEAEHTAAKALREQVTGPAGVCWYAKSTLVTPVFLAQLNPQSVRNAENLTDIKNALASVFGNTIGAYEARASGAADTGYRRLPVETREPSGSVTLWTRAVSTPSGTASSASSSYASQLSVQRYFPVTLALAHGYLVFSPDARLVDDTLAVLDKRYPAVADMLTPSRHSTTVALITPAAAAALIERESGRALPADQETIFRNAARTHLLPKLQAAATYPPLTLSLPATLPTSAGWVPMEWNFEKPIGKGLQDNDASFDRPDGKNTEEY